MNKTRLSDLLLLPLSDARLHTGDQRVCVKMLQNTLVYMAYAAGYVNEQII